jgi:hypothetical protein
MNQVQFLELMGHLVANVLVHTAYDFYSRKSAFVNFGTGVYF